MANYVAPVSGTWAARGSSPFKASRSGGTRYHAGNDLQAKNGTPAVAVIGGTVQYVGHNQGYQWNAVVLGDDGNAYRYATHGPVSVEEGQRVEQGQQVGTIGRGHLHFEVIPPTSPSYKAMVANPGQFVSTSWKPGGEPKTVDPAAFFGVQRGFQIASGQPVDRAIAPDVPQPSQNAPGAFAELTAPAGGTLTPSIPAGTEAYAPFLPGAGSGGQAAIADMLGLPPPPVAHGLAPVVPEPAAPEIAPAPFVPASGPVGPNLGSMLSPADVLAAGPRPRPAALSPVRPPMPNTTDRNLGILPPMPGLRPGGAPDAGMVPLPPMRPAPAASMANMPAMVGMPPSAPPGGVDAFSPPAGPSDLVPFSPPPAATAAAPAASPGSLARESDTLARELGHNRRMMELYTAPSDPRTVASDLTPARLDRMRQARGIGPYPPRPDYPAPNMPSEPAYSDTSRMLDLMPASHYMPPSRPTVTPDFDFAAGPGPTFTPPSLTPDIRGRPEYPGSMPAAPPPLANAADDPYRAPSSFDASRPLNGGGGSDVLAAGNASPLALPPPPPALMPSGDPWAKAYGVQGPTVPSLDEIPGVTVVTDPNNITLPTDQTVPPAQVASEQVPTLDPAAAAANQPYLPPPPRQKIPTTATATPTKTAEAEKKRNSFLSRLLPGGGSIFGIGPNGFFSNAGSFTPFAGAGGTSPFNMQPNGAMGSTTWRQGSVTGNPAMSGVMWNRSGNNGSVGYVTSPFTGDVPIYSGSPNRF